MVTTRRWWCLLCLSLCEWSAACGGHRPTAPREPVTTTTIPPPRAMSADGPEVRWTRELPEENTWLDLELSDRAVWIAGVRGKRPSQGTTQRGRVVCALDVVDGAEQWCSRFDVGERPHHESPGRLFVDATGGVFVGAGTVVAIDPKGEVRWVRGGLNEPNLIGADQRGLYVATRDAVTSSIQHMRRETGDDDGTWELSFDVHDAYQRKAPGAFFVRTSDSGGPVLHAVELDAGSPPKHHEVVRYDGAVLGATALHALLNDLHGEAIDVGEVRRMDWIPWLRVEHGQWSYLQITADRRQTSRATNHVFEPSTSRGDMAFRSFMRGGVPFVLDLGTRTEEGAWVLRRMPFDGPGWELAVRSKDWWAVRITVDTRGFAAVQVEGEVNELMLLTPDGSVAARRLVSEPIGEMELRGGTIASMTPAQATQPRRILYERFE